MPKNKSLSPVLSKRDRVYKTTTHRKKSIKIHSKKNIVIIGSGNVATHMGLAIKKAGHTVLQVYSPNKNNATSLAKKLAAEAIDDLSKIDISAAIFIIAVKDDAIKKVAQALTLKDNIVIHTSGSTEMDVLKNTSGNYGVIYPLQTFSKKSLLNFTNVPLFIEANNNKVATALKSFANSLSKKVYTANSVKRQYIHLAAVFACNFTNHMYSCAEIIAAEQNIPFDTFTPLIEETAKKIRTNSPLKSQTGPAIRSDKKTMKFQEKLLKDKPELKKLYKLISKNIKKSANSF